MHWQIWKSLCRWAWNNNGSIIIRFIDAPINTSFDQEQQIAPEDAEIEQEIEADKSLNNTGNFDPDNITISITVVNNNAEDSNNRHDDNPTKDHDSEFANTEEDIKQTGVDPKMKETSDQLEWP